MRGEGEIHHRLVINLGIAPICVALTLFTENGLRYSTYLQAVLSYEGNSSEYTVSNDK
jgi:hypothetical protein